MIIRRLAIDECARLAEIDPSFVTNKVCTIQTAASIDQCLTAVEVDQPLEVMPPMFGSTSPDAALWYQDHFASYDLFIVAEDEGRFVGAACGMPLTELLPPEVKFLAMRGEYLLSAFAVDRQHRGRGIGRAMLSEVKSHCARMGCSMLSLWTGFDYYPAIAFYQAEGFALSGWQSPPGCKFDECRVYLTWEP